MKQLIVLTYLGLWACVSCAQPSAPTSVVVRAPSGVMLVQAPAPDQAFAYLERTLADMDFFRANNYAVSLPDHSLFDGTATAASNPTEHRAVFVKDVYRAAAFETALSIIDQQKNQLRTAMARIASWGTYDGFNTLDSVTVTLTLYGPGGSFNPDTGDIILWTDTDGRFKGGGSLHTIIHEMIHLAVEHGIAQPLQLQHWERERLVDLLAQREFRDLLPDYRLQGGNEAPMDRFVVNTELSDMREAVAEYVRVGRAN